MLVRIFDFVNKHKFFSLLCLLLWAGVALWGVWQLRFEEDITKVLPQNEKTSLTAKVLKQLNFADKISVIVSRENTGDFAHMQALTDALCDTLRQRLPQYFTDIQGIIPEEELDKAWGFVYEHLPLFLEDKDYDYLAQRLQTDSLRALVQGHYRMMLSPAGMVAQQFVRKDPFSLTFRGLQKLQALNIGTDLTLSEGYLTTQDQRHILFFLNPVFQGSDTEHNTAFVHALEQLQEQFNAQYAGKASCEFFGAPFISVSNASQIKADILTTVLIPKYNSTFHSLYTLSLWCTYCSGLALLAQGKYLGHLYQLGSGATGRYYRLFPAYPHPLQGYPRHTRAIPFGYHALTAQ